MRTRDARRIGRKVHFHESSKEEALQIIGSNEHVYVHSTKLCQFLRVNSLKY